ncbi:hypothetical protein LXA43DRAFT_50529 [Ganoderma leucocontextum]|nr:hypothetical protein LXA43DRAFT_50529 [Ganoderma leucocontextum]
MAIQALPIDILLLIMDVSPLPTIGKMTRTCHALRQSGARSLLEGEVSLTTGSSIISFVQFLYADAATRFPYLCALEIASGELPPRAVDALQGLISHPLLALESLTLREADVMLKSTPTHPHPAGITDPTPLVIAFSALTTLRHLTIDECDQRACSLITAIRSPLRTISIGFTPLTTWHNSEDAQRRNPIVLLANVSDTLEEISASNVAMALEHVMYDIVYPSVRRVSVTYDGIWIPKTLAYTSAFPNLVHFSFTSIRGHPAGDFASPAEFFQATLYRTSNRESQERYGRTWEHLEELVGGAPDVFLLGLTRHVPRLRLTGPSSPDTTLRVVLEDIRPTSLAITLVCAAIFDDDSMASVLRTYPSAEELRTLEMELCLDADEGDVNVHAMLNNVARTLALLPLRDLTLTLNYGLLTNADKSEHPLYPALSDFDSLDLEVTARLFRAAMPSLVDVVVRLSTDCTWYESICDALADDGSAVSPRSGSSDSEDEDEMEGDLGSFMMEEDDHGW